MVGLRRRREAAGMAGSAGVIGGGGYLESWASVARTPVSWAVASWAHSSSG